MLQALSGIRCCFPAGTSGKCQGPWCNRYWQMSPLLPTQSNLFPSGIIHPVLCPWNRDPWAGLNYQPHAEKSASIGSANRNKRWHFQEKCRLRMSHPKYFCLRTTVSLYDQAPPAGAKNHFRSSEDSTCEHLSAGGICIAIVISIIRYFLRKK